MDPRPSKQILCPDRFPPDDSVPWFSTLWKDLRFCWTVFKGSLVTASAQRKPNAEYLFIHATLWLAVGVVAHLSWTIAPLVAALARGFDISVLGWLALIDMLGIFFACIGHLAGIRAWIAYRHEERHSLANAAAIVGYLGHDRNQAAADALNTAAAFWAGDAPAIADQLRSMAREYERARR